MLIAYHNLPSIKTDILAQLETHRVADEIIKGQYWSGGKGCAVGCTIHGSNHSEYESAFGIPTLLACLEDAIFESLPKYIAKAWPERFMSAIEPGQDLSRVGFQFFHWLLTDETINPGIDHPLVRDVLQTSADTFAKLIEGELVGISLIQAIRAKACITYESAISALQEAEMAAYCTHWCLDALIKIRSDRNEGAARSIEFAINSIAYLDKAKISARMADKLLELIAAAPMAPSTR